MKISVTNSAPELEKDTSPLPSLDKRPMGADRACYDPVADWWPDAEPEKVWNDARYADSGSMVILLSGDNRTAWLAVMPEKNTGRPERPLLIHRWTVAGRVARDYSGMMVVEPVSKDILMPSGDGNKEGEWDY